MEKFLNVSIALENPYAGDGWNRGMAATATNTDKPMGIKNLPLYFDPSFKIFVGIIIDDKVAKIYRQKYLKQIRYKY